VQHQLVFLLINWSHLMNYVLPETAVGRLVTEFKFGQWELSYVFSANSTELLLIKTVFVYRVVCYKLGFNA